jgi:hypothetical protein
MPSPLSRILAAFALLVATLSLVACRTVTPAELHDWGTRTYAGTTKAAAFKASFDAVRTLGYDVATADAGAGQIRTAPKVVVVTASGNQYGATAVANSLAWDIDVTQGSQGIDVHATPRGYSAGQSIPPTRMSASYAKQAFETLFGEIERDMGVAAPASSASARR